MPRSEKTQAAQTIVSEASAALNLDLVEKLAQPLAEYLLRDYTAEDWQDSPLVEVLAHVATAARSLTASRTRSGKPQKRDGRSKRRSLETMERKEERSRNYPRS